MSDSPKIGYGSGVASLIGDAGISLDGQSVQIPDESVVDMQDDMSKSVQIPSGSVYDMQDDISSINEYSYYRGMSEPLEIRIIGTAENTEVDNVELLTPSSNVLTNTEGDGKAGQEHDNTMSTAINLSIGDSQKKPPNMKNTSKLSVHRKQRRTLVPKWVAAAPVWLKCVIIFSTAMLVGAVVLVSVALTTALTHQTATSSATLDDTVLSAPNEYDAISTPAPLSTTGALPFDTYAGNTDEPVDDDTGIVEGPVDDANILSPTLAPSLAVTESATPAPSASTSEAVKPAATPRPTVAEQPIDEADDISAPSSTAEDSDTVSAPAPSNPPTLSPDSATQAGQGASGGNKDNTVDSTSTQYDPYVTTFFVTGGRFTNDGLTALPSQLQSMPVRGGTSFMVHLGDWNSPYATRCDEQSYRDVNSLFSNSSAPVYFLPGDNDFNGTSSF